MTLNRRARAILNRFTVPETALLGVGSESSVFAIDDTQVLRIYSPKVHWEYVTARHHLLDKIRQAGWPASLALPEIYSVGAWADQVYTVERRIQGRDFLAVLPALTGETRRHALTSFVEAAAQIGTVNLAGTPYGELLGSGWAMHRAQWHDYLEARLLASLEGSRAAVSQDVPDLDRVLAYTRQALARLEPLSGARLVHGDYYAGNVFVDDEYNICAVGDFGYSTLAGDPRMDLAYAVASWDVPQVISREQAAEDVDFMLHLLHSRYRDLFGGEVGEIVQIYRLYYSFYFSGCGDDDPITYAWCVRNLRRAAEAL